MDTKSTFSWVFFHGVSSHLLLKEIKSGKNENFLLLIFVSQHFLNSNHAMLHCLLGLTIPGASYCICIHGDKVFRKDFLQPPFLVSVTKLKGSLWIICEVISNEARIRSKYIDIPRVDCLWIVLELQDFSGYLRFSEICRNWPKCSAYISTVVSVIEKYRYFNFLFNFTFGTFELNFWSDCGRIWQIR